MMQILFATKERGESIKIAPLGCATASTVSPLPACLQLRWKLQLVLMMMIMFAVVQSDAFGNNDFQLILI